MIQQSIPTKGATIHWAGWYDKVLNILALGRTDKFREMTIALAPLSAGQTVLDVGCGTGHLTAMAQRVVGSSGKVVGIDAAAEMIAAAQTAYPDVDFQLVAVEKTHFPDHTFDVALSSLVLHHLPNELKQTAMAEVLRVLKPGGIFFSVDFTAGGHLNRGNNMRILESMMHSAGYADVISSKTDFRTISSLSGRKPY